MVNEQAWSVRRLHAPDVAAFREMISMFGIAFEDVRTYGARPPSKTYLLAFLGREDAIVMAAFAGDRVIGGLVAYVLTKFEQASDYRRRGIARSLIEALKDESAAAGAYVIFVQADPWDGPAIGLYESLGKREDVLHFDIEVPRSKG
jgi:aminoglycoside 3-N-acetyltransferase I